MIPKVSNVFLVSFVLCLAISCSSAKPNPAEELGYSLQSVQALTSRYGSIDSPNLRIYLDYLSARLMSGYSVGSDQLIAPKIQVTRAAEPMAHSAGMGFIVISAGLFKRISTEGELAFIIAHEMGHQHLGHSRYQAEPGAGGTTPEKELAADAWALGIISAAGYDPRVALSALMHFGDIREENGQANYPPLPVRLQRIQKQIKDSGWRPAGTVDRREFRQIKDSLGRLHSVP